MSTNLKLNALLSLPKNFKQKLEVDKRYTIQKSGMRIMPFSIPMELSTHDHKYLAKIRVEKLEVIKNHTLVTFRVLKLFSKKEQEVYTKNFIKS